MPTLADLTLQLSRDLSALHRRCLERLESLERERWEALRGLRGARTALTAYEKALADAGTLRDKAHAQADALERVGEREAFDRRRAALDKADARMREADEAALVRREAEELKAREAYDKALADVAKNRTMAEQTLLRVQAHQRFRDTREAIEAAYLSSLASNRDRQQTDRRAALDQERVAARAARDEATAVRQAAETVHQRAQKAAETRLRTALIGVDGADALMAELDARRAQAKRQCRTEEEALFAEFRRQREAEEVAD